MALGLPAGAEQTAVGQAILAVTDDPAVQAAMWYGASLEGGLQGPWDTQAGGNQVGGDGEVGPWQIHPIHFQNIAPDAAADPNSAALYMLPRYQDAAKSAGNLWQTDPEAAIILTIANAERPQGWHEGLTADEAMTIYGVSGAPMATPDAALAQGTGAYSTGSTAPPVDRGGIPPAPAGLVETVPGTAYDPNTGMVYEYKPERQEVVGAGDGAHWETVPAGWNWTEKAITRPAGAGATAQLVIQEDGTGVWVDPARPGWTEDAKLPAGLTKPETISVPSGTALYERQPDGSLKEIVPADGNWQVVNVGGALYRVNADTGQYEKIGDVPMSELDRQQLALQWAELGRAMPNVAYDFGGTRYQQVRPEAQVMAGQTPHVAFGQRPVGAPAGTPFTPAPAGGPVRPEPQPQGVPAPPFMEDKGRPPGLAPVLATITPPGYVRDAEGRLYPSGPMTAEKAANIGAAFASSGLPRGNYARLSGLAAVPMAMPALGSAASALRVGRSADTIGGGFEGPARARKRAKPVIAAMALAPRLPLASEVGAAPPPVKPAGATPAPKPSLAVGLKEAYRKRKPKRLAAVA